MEALYKWKHNGNNNIINTLRCWRWVLQLFFFFWFCRGLSVWCVIFQQFYQQHPSIHRKLFWWRLFWNFPWKKLVVSSISVQYETWSLHTFLFSWQIYLIFLWVFLFSVTRQRDLIRAPWADIWDRLFCILIRYILQPNFSQASKRCSFILHFHASYNEAIFSHAESSAWFSTRIPFRSFWSWDHQFPFERLPSWCRNDWEPNLHRF